MMVTCKNSTRKQENFVVQQSNSRVRSTSVFTSGIALIGVEGGREGIDAKAMNKATALMQTRPAIIAHSSV